MGYLTVDARSRAMPHGRSCRNGVAGAQSRESAYSAIALSNTPVPDKQHNDISVGFLWQAISPAMILPISYTGQGVS